MPTGESGSSKAIGSCFDTSLNGKFTHRISYLLDNFYMHEQDESKLKVTKLFPGLKWPAVVFVEFSQCFII